MKAIFLLILVLLGVSLAQLPDGTYVQLFQCDGSMRQQWDISRVLTPGQDQTIRLLQQESSCLDINSWGTDNGDVIHLWTCHTDDKDPTHQNQEFVYHSDTQTFVGTQSGRCIEAAGGGTTEGTGIVIWDCNGGADQKWVFNATDNTLRGGQSGLCLDAGSTNPAACTAPPTSTYPFCNTDLSIDQRVQDLVQRIPPATKWNLLGTVAGPVTSLGIASYNWGAEGLHGVAGSTGVQFIGNTTCATSFAQVCTTGASFDIALWAGIAEVISTEARAFANAGHAGLTFWTPNLNNFRDPRWGRGQEVVGEDPYHTSQYVLHYVTNLQNSSVDPSHLKISACCKHFACYSFENWGGQDRCGFNANVTNQDLADTFYPPFETCISPNGAASAGIMCSYNAINGIPACADTSLLTGLARQQWNFNGYITGDCGAVDCVQNNHHYTNNPNDTCAVVLDAGMDVDCGSFLQSNLPTAVASGKVTPAVVDSALSNLLAVQMRLGMFDPPGPYTKIGIDQINTPAAQELALRNAQEGIVLLKNVNNALPLKPDQSSTVAVIGPNAQATTVMQGNYYGTPCVDIITPQQAINKFAQVNYAQGCTVTGNDTSGFAAACTAAKGGSATIIIAGLTNDVEHEGIDRTVLTWPGVQEQMILQTAQCSAGPVILVVFGGGPIDLTSVRDSKLISAIIWVGYGGQAGGTAIANAIFGVFSPAGRLPHTNYPADFVNQVADTNMGYRPTTNPPNPGRTYRFYTGTPVYEFGTGLSYTNFTYVYTNVSHEVVRAADLSEHLYAEQSSFLTAPAVASVQVKVTNVGTVTSDSVILAFVIPPNAGQNGNPKKVLFGFTRFNGMGPGSSNTINFPLSAYDLSLVDENGKRAPILGKWRVVVEDQETVIAVVE